MAFTLNTTTLQALIQERYTPVLYDLFFSKRHLITTMLKNKAKTYTERRIKVPLEYDEATTVEAVAEWDTLTLKPTEIVTDAYFDPAMIVGTLTISKKEQLEMNSPGAIKNIIDVRMKNLRKAMEKYFATNLWKRSQGTNDWNTFDTLIGIASLGGIVATGTVPAWWKAKIIDVSSDTWYAGENPAAPDHYKNSSKELFLLRLLQRAVALSSNQTDEDPTVICLTPYMWDLLEFIYNSQKLGTKMNEMAAKLGFTAIDYRGIPVVRDKDMVVAQTSDTDGRIGVFNLDYQWMWFNPGARFTVGKFIEPHNQPSMSAKVIVYGNHTVANRAAQCFFKNVYTPREYGTG